MARKKEKFEEALQKLEAIVAQMEEGDLSLEETLKAFEEGVRLAKFCTTKLDEAERKVEKLIRDQAGKVQPVPFSEEEDDG
ncbi:MAG: exodeoxyribonuclease VII small subunit [Deltaproteobacteria bacterium]|jgi:exodeoxyribonuclease VII small subunit|nr:MAG: exodeoxyribonuclease VII small subunit [Deltaproteobacteria bacterium]